MSKNRVTLRVRHFPGAMVSTAANGRSRTVFGGSDNYQQALSMEQVSKLIDQSWSLFRALRLRADAVSVPTLVPLTISDSSPAPITRGPVYDIINKPNEWFSRSELMALVEYDLCTSDNGAFLLLDRFQEINGKERPTQMWRMDPRRVTVVQGDANDPPEQWYVKHFLYDANAGGMLGARRGKAEPITPDRVIWIRVVNPFNELTNQSVIRPAFGAAMLIVRAMISNRSLHESGVTGAGIVKPRENGMAWTTSQLDEIAAVLQETIIGEGGANRIGVVNRPDMEFVSLASLSPRDMQFTQLIALMDRAISQATGVPFPLIDPSEVILSNAKQARQILFSNTTVPSLRRIESALSTQLIDVWYSDMCQRVTFDISTIPELADEQTAKWLIDSGKLDALLSLIERVRGGGLDVGVARELAITHIGLTDRLAEALIPEPGGEVIDGEIIDVPDAVDSGKIAEIVKAIAESVYSGGMPLGVGQQIIDSLMGDDAIVLPALLAAVAPGEAPPDEPPPAPPTGLPPSTPTRPTGGGRPARPSQGPTARSAATSRGGGVLEYGSDEHRREWERLFAVAKGFGLAIFDEIEPALVEMVSAAKEGENTTRAKRSYIALIAGIISAASRKYSPAELRARANWEQKVASRAEKIVSALSWAIAVAHISDDEALERVREACVDLGCAYVNSSALDAASSGGTKGRRGARANDDGEDEEDDDPLDFDALMEDDDPDEFDDFIWLSQLDPKVRASHRAAHGKKSEKTMNDFSTNGRWWKIGDGTCYEPGDCSSAAIGANCRCFVQQLTPETFAGMKVVKSRDTRIEEHYREGYGDLAWAEAIRKTVAALPDFDPSSAITNTITRLRAHELILEEESNDFFTPLMRDGKTFVMASSWSKKETGYHQAYISIAMRFVRQLFSREALESLGMNEWQQEPISFAVSPTSTTHRANYAVTRDLFDGNLLGRKIALAKLPENPSEWESDHWIGIAVHELGHYMEDMFASDTGKYGNDDRLGGHYDAIHYLQERSKGNQLRKLRDITGVEGYRDDEEAFESSSGTPWPSPYVGKKYQDFRGTEIISMGIEMLHNDPVKFAREDPDLFNFIMGFVKRRGG